MGRPPSVSNEDDAPIAIDLDGVQHFKCPFCGRTFNKKANCKIHVRKHTGEMPYKCSVAGCSRKFMWKSSLTFHETNGHRRGTETGTEATAAAAAVVSTAAPVASSLPETTSVDERVSGVKQEPKKLAQEGGRGKRPRSEPDSIEISLLSPAKKGNGMVSRSLFGSSNGKKEDYNMVSRSPFSSSSSASRTMRFNELQSVVQKQTWAMNGATPSEFSSFGDRHSPSRASAPASTDASTKKDIAAVETSSSRTGEMLPPLPRSDFQMETREKASLPSLSNSIPFQNQHSIDIEIDLEPRQTSNGSRYFSPLDAHESSPREPLGAGLASAGILSSSGPSGRHIGLISPYVNFSPVPSPMAAFSPQKAREVSSMCNTHSPATLSSILNDNRRDAFFDRQQ